MPTIPSNTSVLEQVAALPNLSLTELKSLWQTLYNTKPNTQQKSLLVRRLSYRLQELAYGVDPDINKRLTEQAKHYYPDNKKTNKRKRNHYTRPMVGARLVRHYKGINYTVTVLEHGYEYDGCVYTSLSKIATLITGNNCSGVFFFGLRKNNGVTV